MLGLPVARGGNRTGYELGELADRYKLALQLRRLAVDGGRQSGDFPDGLSRDANPHADSHWEDRPPPAPPGTPLVDAVERLVRVTVLGNASVCGVAFTACDDFNRLAARLTGLARAPIFFHPRPPSPASSG